MPDAYLTVAEAAARLGVAVVTIRKYITHPHNPLRTQGRFGRRMWRLAPEDVDAYVPTPNGAPRRRDEEHGV